MKSKRFIDARKLEREKDIMEFRAKLLYAMPKVPLKGYPRNDNMELRCNALPGLFNKINTYGEVNRKDKGQVFQRRLYQKMINETDSEVSYNDSLDEEFDDSDPDLNVDPRFDSDSDDNQVVDHQVNVIVHRVENDHSSDDDVNQDVDVDGHHHFDVVVHRAEQDDDDDYDDSTLR